MPPSIHVYCHIIILANFGEDEIRRACIIISSCVEFWVVFMVHSILTRSLRAYIAVLKFCAALLSIQLLAIQIIFLEKLDYEKDMRNYRFTYYRNFNNIRGMFIWISRLNLAPWSSAFYAYSYDSVVMVRSFLTFLLSLKAQMRILSKQESPSRFS